MRCATRTRGAPHTRRRVVRHRRAWWHVRWRRRATGPGMRDATRSEGRDSARRTWPSSRTSPREDRAGPAAVRGVQRLQPGPLQQPGRGDRDADVRPDHVQPQDGRVTPARNEVSFLGTVLVSCAVHSEREPGWQGETTVTWRAHALAAGGLTTASRGATARAGARPPSPAGGDNMTLTAIDGHQGRPLHARRTADRLHRRPDRDRARPAAWRCSGGAPATRDTDLLSPTKMVEQIYGIALSGGSLFGLDPATACCATSKTRTSASSMATATFRSCPALDLRSRRR